MSFWDAENDARYYWRNLQNAWDDARQVWHDVPAMHFEHEYWVPLEQTTLDFLDVLKEFTLVLDDAEQVGRARW